jgi:hypothetical protein
MSSCSRLKAAPARHGACRIPKFAALFDNDLFGGTSMSTREYVGVDRRLDRAETLFWFLDRCSSMNFAVIAEVRGALGDSALQAALERAQRRHPLLRAAVEADAEQRLRFAPRAASGIPLWRIAAGSDWRSVLAEHIVQPFPLGESPLVRACQIDRGAGAWVFALILHHPIADARSGFSLLGEILRDAAGLPVPNEPVAPRPSLVELYPAAFAGEAGSRLGEQLTAARKAAAEHLGRPQPQAGHRQGEGQARPRILTRTFEARLAEALAGRTRAAGTTITGLIGACQLVALRRLFGDEAERVLGLTCAADLRPYLSAPTDDATPGFYATLVTSVQRVGDAAGLWPLAQRLTASLRQQLAAGAGHLLYDFLPPADRFPATEAGVEGFRALMARAAQTSLLSNAGRLPALPELPGLHVAARSFSLFPTPTQPVFTAVASDAGRMTININYNAGQFDDNAATRVADAIDVLLREAAGLPS